MANTETQHRVEVAIDLDSHADFTYDCMMTGNSYVMILRNALCIPSIDVCLLHPIMMRLAGLEVDECPKFLSNKPTVNNHSIFFPDRNLRLPLTLDGVISCLPCRTQEAGREKDNERMGS